MWGYLYTGPKGGALWNYSQDLHLILVTDPGTPTRVGTEANSDPTPDLTFTKNIEKATWRNTLEDFGSNHSISELQVKEGPNRSNKRQIKLIDWELLRRTRETTQQRSITDIEQWTKDLSDYVKDATRTAPPDSNLEKSAVAFLHVWEAKQSLQNRLKGQKHNRNLRKHTVLLKKEIEYATQLSKQQWDDICNSMDGHLSTGKTWHMLRFLLHHENDKKSHRQTINKLIHAMRAEERNVSKN
ncbi:hypothetical protein HPB49_013986 [Dermacentor silvarum]|uniref:Uncharacterized protein n=1 Tax=Dermacentor silvarum TaxID=543639 RepID=A0ACB8CFJ4_DERSI|nr:hypothetical protein HPB49_013986 [Dermacentor silvarum]